MNTANLKTYAPQSRKDFLTAVTNRALKLGISEKGHAEVTVQGDLMLIGGTAYPRTLDAQRNQLIKKIQKSGFAHVMEEAAYTWFNRFMAIRYMEVHGYFPHGFRVLSNPSGGNQPEILQQAQSVAIPGLDNKRVVELLSQGNQQDELYRTLILGQSKALGQAMPFLFDTIDTSTELLLPDGLLAPQSVVRKLVSEIPEDDWQSTEILGWLYQFYVSDEKARVDALVKKGQAVQPEDIPAKTQLFTPNWIVQFMTQNSLGRLWMDVYPDSPLMDKMPHYTPPAEQEPEVAAKLREITPSSLDPNTLTAIDPAAGSGHILLVLYDLFYEFYREAGYPPADIPRLIVSQNLYGLELDRRAAQIAGFAVLMRARRDDPSLLARPPVVNVLSLVSSYGINAEAIADTLLAPIRGRATIAPEDGLFPELAIQPRLAEAAETMQSEATHSDVKALVELFEEADVYGSLIRVSESLRKRLPALRDLVQANLGVPELDRQATARELSHLVRQAEFLAARYTVCVANPPYLGGNAMVAELKDFAKDNYPDTKSDLFAMFLERGFDFAGPNGFNAMVTMQSWMFLASFIEFRRRVIEEHTILAMAHLGARAFPTIQGDAVRTSAVVLSQRNEPSYRATFHRLTEPINEAKADMLRSGAGRYDSLRQFEFKSIPGWPIAYYTTVRVRLIFKTGTRLDTLAKPREGITTGCNANFVRSWWEVPRTSIRLGVRSRAEARQSGGKWFPYIKGGEFRKWFGNQEHVVNWESDGKAISGFTNEHGKPRSFLRNSEVYFKRIFSCTKVSGGAFSIRYYGEGFIFDNAAPSFIGDESGLLEFAVCALNSCLAKPLMSDYAPTINFTVGNVSIVPIIPDWKSYSTKSSLVFDGLVTIFKSDWNEYETSWEFIGLAPSPAKAICVSAWWTARTLHCELMVREALHLEEENNLIMANAYGLSCEVETPVDLKEISLLANPLHVFRPKRKKDEGEDEESELSSAPVTDGAESDEEELSNINTKFRIKGLKELVSYSIGTIMGRYSLDEPGLIYAHQGGVGFDPSRYGTFPADRDGILPVTEDDFFGDEDTANRFARWVRTVWPNSPLDENLDFIADALGRKANETTLESIRRYLATEFYKDHLQTYKKRPIYWLFSSGKHRAFQALVYLHRYNESTLSTMRSDYVTPLFGKLSAQINDAQIATENGSAAERNKAAKRLKKLQDQLQELHAFDQRLHHYALQRISLDLDDGVKVNYGKFSDPTIGEILANVKDITGGKDD